MREAGEAEHGEQRDGEEGGLVLGVSDELEDSVEEEPARSDDQEQRGERSDRCGSERRAKLRARAAEQRGDDEEGDDGQVLEEKDAEGSAAESRCELALLGEELDDKGGGGEGGGCAVRDLGCVRAMEARTSRR